MMKKLLTMTVVLVMLSTLGVCYASDPLTENMQEIGAILTNIKYGLVEYAVNEVISDEREPGALGYKPHGSYNLTGDYLKVYTFDGANSFYEVVCMDKQEDHIMVIHDTGSHGPSFCSRIYKGAKFCGLTENYVLYEDKSNVIAITVEDKKDCKIGEYQYEVIPFDELSEEEQSTAVYPTGFFFKQF